MKPPTRTATLRLLVAMMAELPTPKGIEFGTEDYLTLTFDTVYDLEQWNATFGLNEQQYRKASNDGSRLVTFFTGLWHNRGMSAWVHESTAELGPLVEVTAQPTAEAVQP